MNCSRVVQLGANASRARPTAYHRVWRSALALFCRLCPRRLLFDLSLGCPPLCPIRLHSFAGGLSGRNRLRTAALAGYSSGIAGLSPLSSRPVSFHTFALRLLSRYQSLASCQSCLEFINFFGDFFLPCFEGFECEFKDTLVHRSFLWSWKSPVRGPAPQDGEVRIGLAARQAKTSSRKFPQKVGKSPLWQPGSRSNSMTDYLLDCIVCGASLIRRGAGRNGRRNPSIQWNRRFWTGARFPLLRL